MLDLLFKGGWVIDGLGAPMYRADVGVENGTISAVGDLGEAEAVRTIDCEGLCISPGWVDIHSHADWSVLEHSIGLNLLIQGCTLTVAGNCGGSPAPMQGRATAILERGEMRRTVTTEMMQQRYPSGRWSAANLLAEIEKERPGINYVQLVGHNQL